MRLLNKLTSLARDATWADRAPAGKWQLSLCTFGILALELALIRWTTSQIRVFAYFNNIVLIGAFLGMGLGLALGRRYPGLIHGLLPALLCLAVPLAFAEELHLVHLRLPDPQNVIFLWNSSGGSDGFLTLAGNLGLFVGLYLVLVGVFVFAGAPVGHLFGRLANLRAYSWDLAGSLAGVVVFMLVNLLGAGPPAWLLLGGLPFAVLLRSRAALLALMAIALLAQYSVKGAIFSPYNRIDLIRVTDGYRLHVNRDFHQFMFDFSGRTGPLSESARGFKRAYDLAFSVNPRRNSALVVGAGTGNDVQAALRNGYGRVLSVDIDAEIIRAGQRYHPEEPYSSARVQPVVNDARAFFEQYRGPPFDVVCFGILDSHAMFSSMSSLRLDNFVYTREGIAAAWRQVGPGGHLSLSFAAFWTPWIADRLYWTITAATGREPLCLINGQYAYTYICARDDARLDLGPAAGLPRFQPVLSAAEVHVSTDDWPFLYLQPRIFPWIYFLMLCTILAVAVVGVKAAFPGTDLVRRFDWPAFFMGTAFLLLQTRGITCMAVLVGSTWIVNSAVFLGILSMALLACLTVERWRIANPNPWFIALFVSLLLLAFFRLADLNALPLPGRILAGGLLLGVPLGLAGVIFPVILSRSRDPAVSLGANLLGAVLGGCLEYLSMAWGLQMLVFLALFFYVLAMVAGFRRPAAIQ